MTRDRMLHGFNAFLYAANGVLWQVFAHNTGLAICSILVAIGSAVAMRMADD